MTETEGIDPKEAKQAVVSLWRGLVSFGMVGLFLVKNWAAIAALVPVIFTIQDFTVGHHVISRAWHSNSQEVSREAHAQDSVWLAPYLKEINATNNNTILILYALNDIPGGKKALQRAIEQRTHDSAAAASWKSTAFDELLYTPLATRTPHAATPYP